MQSRSHRLILATGTLLLATFPLRGLRAQEGEGMMKEWTMTGWVAGWITQR